jgi:hypothetical protein
MLHGNLTGDNVVFNDEGLIQICDFCVHNTVEVGGNSDVIAEVGGFSGKGWRPAADVRAFSEFLSRIVIGDSAQESRSSLSVLAFVLEMIARG